MAAEADQSGASEPAETRDVLAGAPEGDNTDALLSMFQSTESTSGDNTLLLELAGDIDLADLLESLHTVAAALGIVNAERAPTPIRAETLAAAA
jgi:hypothetical protein